MPARYARLRWACIAPVCASQGVGAVREACPHVEPGVGVAAHTIPPTLGRPKRDGVEWAMCYLTQRLSEGP